MSHMLQQSSYPAGLSHCRRLCGSQLGAVHNLNRYVKVNGPVNIHMQHCKLWNGSRRTSFLPVNKVESARHADETTAMLSLNYLSAVDSNAVQASGI